MISCELTSSLYKNDMTDLIEVNCAACDEIIEVFDDSEGFNCPYCHTNNVFVDDDDTEEEEVEEITVTTDDPLVLGRSIIISWCRRHKTTEHVWSSNKIIGVRLFCLSCWPSAMPKRPIRHLRREI